MSDTHILIVDPDEISRRRLARPIEKAGFSVIGTGRADRAVSYLEKHNPDLAILDVAVKGLTPEDMLAELKILANKKDIPYQSLAKIYLARQIALERGS